MKLARPDLTSMILAAVCVVAITGLALYHRTIPDVLTFVAMGALGIGGGIATNSTSVDSAAGRITASLSSLEQLVADLRAGKLSAAADDVAAAAADVAAIVPAPAAPAPAIPAPAIPAPAVPINGYPTGVAR